MSKLIIFTAPSGAGKTTIVRHLLKKRNDLAFSISACTREQRYGEVNGLDYYFMTPQEFRRKIEEDAFLEWEEVYEGQYYGTLQQEVERLLDMGRNVVLDVDVKGAWSIKKRYGDRALTVFVKPPSPEVLFERLRNRKTEDLESLRRRIERAKEELTYERRFDVSLLNDELDRTLLQAETLVDDFIRHGIKNPV